MRLLGVWPLLLCHARAFTCISLRDITSATKSSLGVCCWLFLSVNGARALSEKRRAVFLPPVVFWRVLAWGNHFHDVFLILTFLFTRAAGKRLDCPHFFFCFSFLVVMSALSPTHSFVCVNWDACPSCPRVKALHCFFAILHLTFFLCVCLCFVSWSR
jgi:hypothetical protein